MDGATCFIWVFGIFIHVVFLLAALDIYYRSPVIQNIATRFQASVETPAADRLVLFVADGLRAHEFYGLDEEGYSRVPFLKNRWETCGKWGISNTRVPTESRPGHVALIAGLYEDVSAVMQGWQSNPVEFDSVFNQSKYTWSWGSPDIVPMFAKGASGDHIFTFTYPEHLEDFASEDASKLDTWVFDSVTDFMKQNLENSQLKAKKTVFFLHLLGLDTNGHGYKPYSKQYLDNIKLVDSGVENVTKLFEDYFNHDNRTAFIFTADHGMTDWGSHGTGHEHETLTPLVVWGAGIAQPEQKVAQRAVEYPWIPTDGSDGVNVDQADVAPLMSALLGLNFPANSVGKLPVDFFSETLKRGGYVYRALLANWLELCQQFVQKREGVYFKSFKPFFREFPRLNASLIKNLYAHFEELSMRAEFETAQKLILESMDVLLDGIEHFHRYNRPFFIGLIFSGFVAWIGFLLMIAANPVQSAKIFAPNSIFYVFLVIVFLSIQVLHFEMQTMVYIFIPSYLVLLTFRVYSGGSIKHRLPGKKFLKISVGFVVGIEVLVWTFYYRWVLSLFMCTLVPVLLLNTNWSGALRWKCGLFIIGASIFLMLPPVGPSVNYLLVLVTAFTVALGLVIMVNWNKLLCCHDKILTNALAMGVALCGFLVFSTAENVKAQVGLSKLNQVLSWSALCLGFCAPLLTNQNAEPVDRMVVFSVSLFMPMTLTSIYYEPIFYTFLATALCVWVHFESKGDDISSKGEGMFDFFRAYLVLFLAILAFFGTGNIASLNSFNPTSIQCFVTVFKPFLMMSLLVLKILIPFILVAFAQRLVSALISQHGNQWRTKRIFILVTAYSDCIALHFFLWLRDSGSWLDIGTSISHFVIAIAAALVLIFLNFIIGIYLKDNYVLCNYVSSANKDHFH